mmetsp:Transcript_57354/g.65040  ORF Transcript_57354/g.65040 Transcript_57354/m.65040 type:complete len:151 (-) Transcript_57354:837-1289(-)
MGWAANSYSLNPPNFPVCSNLEILADNCNNETGLVFCCYTKTAIDAILKHAENPQSSFPRPPDRSVLDPLFNRPNSMTLGCSGASLGAGGMFFQNCNVRPSVIFFEPIKNDLIRYTVLLSRLILTWMGIHIATKDTSHLRVHHQNGQMLS